MSSPSPDIQKTSDHAYQTSESSDHALLTHAHTCPCTEKTSIDNPKTADGSHTHCITSSHHHNVINLSHIPPTTTSHIHPISQAVHVHVHASPKSGHAPKVTTTKPKCNCHLQDNNDSNVETQEQNIAASGRKLEADDRIEVSPLPPALPPRPPPRPRFDEHGTLSSRISPRECKYLINII